MEKRIIIFVFVFKFCFLNGQDIHFTQFYSAPTFLNPAFTGANVCSRMSIIYRNQWPGVKKTYTSYLLAYDHSIQHKNVGIGINIGVDEAGTGSLRTTLINPIVSYAVKLNRFSSLRFGLQPGIGMKTINFSKLIFGDQIYRGGKDVSPLETQPQSFTYFDLGAGTLFNTAKFWIGISAYHLNKPNESFYNKPNTYIPIKYSVHVGRKFSLSNDRDIFNVNDKVQINKKSITLAAHYRNQNKFDQLDVGFYYSQYVFNLGFWYRGIPRLKAYKSGYSNNDAISIVIGLATERLNIGYSYDLTISYLTPRSFGAHELTLSYQMCNPKKLNKKRLVLVSCPKF